MESSKSLPPSAPSVPYLTTPASSPVPNGVQPELSGPSVSRPTFKWSEDRFSDYEDNIECHESSNSANLLEDKKGEEEESLFVKDQTAEGNEKSISTAENEAGSPKTDRVQRKRTVEQSETILVESSDSSDLSDAPDDDKDADYKDANNSSSDEDEDEADGQTKSSLSNQKEVKKEQRIIAKNAREYMERFLEKQERRCAKQMEPEKDKKSKGKSPRKRMATGNDKKPCKALKTSDGSSKPIFNDSSSTADTNSLLPMEPIKAKTHAEQFAQLRVAQLKAQIPHNFDTRRRNTQGPDLRQAVKLFGYKKVEAEDGRWKLKGMECALQNHQLTGTAWMVKRELGRDKPFGGLLADAPGMGKTIESLACIVGNPADEKHRKEFCNATLVVVPNKVDGGQWEEEIQKHCKSPIKDQVFMYDPRYSDLKGKCERSFVVITTYNEIVAQYLDNSVLRELKEKYDSDDVSFRREFRARAGLIFNIEWYRIILDEAHAIKNINSRTCQACCALPGKYRWALTGTPLANSSDEMYPYLKFLDCKSTWDSKEFKSAYTTSDGKSNSEFEALVSMTMYRRTQKDEFLGHKIIDLPEKNEVELLIPLSIEEEVLVEAVKKFFDKTAKDLDQGTLGEDKLKAAIDSDLNDLDEAEGEEKDQKKSKASNASPQSASCKLGHSSQMRKRQVISHVFCIEPCLRKLFEPEDLRELMGALDQVSMKQTILEQLRSSGEEYGCILRYETGLQILQERKETMFGKHFDMKTLLNLTLGESLLRDRTCPICQKPPADPVYGENCGHIFCTKCICRATKGQRRTDKRAECPYEDCGKDLEVGDDIEALQSTIGAKDKSYREPGKDSNNVIMRRDDDRNGFFVCNQILDNAPIVPSTRLTATMAVVLTWLQEAPNDKIIIFTLFIGTAKVLGHMLETLNIGFVYNYGGLSPGQKRKALNAFKQNEDVKVMISTLKSGGQSLNLVEANRVIIVDRWWNKAAEQQAFGRVLRIGQQKKTYLVRIRTQDEVDSKIHSLQLKKAADVDYTLQDDDNTPPSTNEIERQRNFCRKKEQQEARLKNRKPRQTKKKQA